MSQCGKGTFIIVSMYVVYFLLRWCSQQHHRSSAVCPDCRLTAALGGICCVVHFERPPRATTLGKERVGRWMIMVSVGVCLLLCISEVAYTCNIVGDG